ncbi:MAG: AI-2E family transporter [Candidatus Nanohalobium sp.]
MGEEGHERTQRETLLVMLALFAGSMVIVYPFLDALVLAVAVSYLLGFAHRKINSRLKNELLSSTIVITSIIGFLSLTVYFFINNAFYIQDQFMIFAGSLEQNVINTLKALQVPQVFIENVQNYFDTFSSKASTYLIQIFFSLPSALIDLSIFLVTAIFLYRDRSKLGAELEGLLNALPETEEKIIRSLMQSVDSIFRGVFVTQTVVALILSIATGLGFYIISLFTSPMPLIPLWSILVALAGLLPLIAAFMIYAPVGVYYMTLAGEPVKGLLIITYGVIMLQILPEIFLRPYVGSKSLDEHPLIVFFGFLAGPLVLGIKGIIIGPLVLILTKEFLFNYADLVSGEPAQNHTEDKGE